MAADGGVGARASGRIRTSKDGGVPICGIISQGSSQTKRAVRPLDHRFEQNEHAFSHPKRRSAPAHLEEILEHLDLRACGRG